MRKFIAWTLAAFPLLFVAAPSFAHIRTFEDNGGYYDVDPEAAPNFFLEDANDLAPSLGAKIPNMAPCAGIISSEFGWRRLSRHHARMHEGVDIAAAWGSPVLAPADGTVAFAGRKNGYGLTVVIDHGGNLTTLFGHNSEIFVKEGQTVKKGQEISQVGSTGHSTGPHVHYEVRIDGTPTNPSRYL